MSPYDSLHDISTFSVQKWYFSVFQVELQFPSMVPEGARDLISKLLRYNPNDRLPLQRVMEHQWVRANARRVLPPECPTQKS